MKFNSYSSYYSSIIAFKGNGGTSDFQNPGDRVPAIKLYGPGRNFEFTINSGSKLHANTTKNMIELDRWYSLVIEQLLIDGKVDILINQL